MGEPKCDNDRLAAEVKWLREVMLLEAQRVNLAAANKKLLDALIEIERGLDVFVEGEYSYRRQRAIRPYRDAARLAIEEARGDG